MLETRGDELRHAVGTLRREIEQCQVAGGLHYEMRTPDEDSRAELDLDDLVPPNFGRSAPGRHGALPGELERDQERGPSGADISGSDPRAAEIIAGRRERRRLQIELCRPGRELAAEVIDRLNELEWQARSAQAESEPN